MLQGEVECDEVYVVAGHKGYPDFVTQQGRLGRRRRLKGQRGRRSIILKGSLLGAGDGFHEVHVNITEGFWSLLRSWLRPHRDISQEKLPLYLAFFEFVHNVRA